MTVFLTDLCLKTFPQKLNVGNLIYFRPIAEVADELSIFPTITAKCGSKIPLNWRTKNYVGTIYGGSLYAGIDPIYMLMLIKTLGQDYLVWDKAATIRFKRPGKETLFADFLLTEAELDEIKAILETEKSVDRVYQVELKDKSGNLHCLIEKTLYIAKKKN